MSFWNSAIGAMIGFTIGGPIGALVGGVIGAKYGKKKGRFSFSSNPNALDTVSRDVPAIFAISCWKGSFLIDTTPKNGWLDTVFCVLKVHQPLLITCFLI